MKRLFALLLAFVLIFTVSACSFSIGNTDDPVDDPGSNVEDPSDDPGEDPGDDPGEDPSDDPGTDPGDTDTGVEGDFYNFESDTAEDSSWVVFNLFKELAYTITTESEEGVNTVDFSYVLVGEDSELEANKYEVTVVEDGTETVYEAWVNENDEMVKAGTNGEYSTGEMAVLHAMGFMWHLIWFYAYNDGYSDAFIEDDFEGYGWAVEERTTGTEDFGDGSVPVQRYKFSYSWFGEDLGYEWEVAKIDGKNLFSRWKMVVNEEVTEMDASRIIPH